MADGVENSWNNKVTHTWWGVYCIWAFFLNCTWCELLVKLFFLLILYMIGEWNRLSSMCEASSWAPEDEPCPRGGWWLEWFIHGHIPGKGAFQEQKRRKTSENFGRCPPPQPLPHPRSIYFMSPTWEQCFDILGTTGLLLLSWNKPRFQCRNFARHLKAKSPLVFTWFLVWTLPTLG